jgi:hypothetical protein
MNIRLFALGLALAALVGCATANPRAKLVWAGIYCYDSAERQADASTPSGFRLTNITQPRLLTRATTIKAELGRSFGIAYRLKRPGANAIPYRVHWQFPADGLTNPRTKVTHHTFERELGPSQAKTRGLGWSFTEPWELVPGIWQVQILCGDQVLLAQSFEVVLP